MLKSQLSYRESSSKTSVPLDSCKIKKHYFCKKAGNLSYKGFGFYILPSLQEGNMEFAVGKLCAIALQMASP